MSMAKRKISQWWLAGLAAMFPAGVLIPSSALALAARQRGDGVRDGYGRAMLALIVLGGLCALTNHAPARLRGADLARVALCICPRAPDGLTAGALQTRVPTLTRT